ncbi:dephospho-CoA kinase [Stappia taiwanensis]|uniref:Dephospho-CoA kinase n=1 Tax=Stappia taiwanensis TaxID=992267 RepID=A0A838XWV9_9HYPH|nr:dephospho-CoA kinase [Stappia taiwanensis]MBA4612966.1 dephospho-CoA kinase [Stappia taiwanensis]GGF06443.1 dephospho-CoA kinase [Stappia taiwanensis]
MIVLGLTGSIGMGKSTTATMFAEAGAAVYDADAAVHALYRGAAVPLIEAAFPGTTRDGAVDRKALSAKVMGDGAAMTRLEGIVHPLVRGSETAFLDSARAAGARVAVLDIPLLFETGGEARVHASVVVTAAPEVQRQRVLARPNMTPESFAAILSRQMADADKRRRAHFLVDTGRGLEPARRAVQGILRALSACE